MSVLVIEISDKLKLKLKHRESESDPNPRPPPTTHVHSIASLLDNHNIHLVFQICQWKKNMKHAEIIDTFV